MESWKVGELKGWKVGRLERLNNWKIGASPKVHRANQETAADRELKRAVKTEGSNSMESRDGEFAASPACGGEGNERSKEG